MNPKFICRRIWRKIHDCIIVIFRHHRMLRECCERGAMMQALLGVVPPAFRIAEINFLNNPGESMSFYGPIFSFNDDIGYGPNFMRTMRLLNHFPYMRLRHDGIDGDSTRYDYVLYANEIARMELMYRHGRAGRKVNKRTLPIVNPTVVGYRDSLLTKKISAVSPMCEFDLGKMMYRNRKKVRNPFSYIPRLNIHKKAADGTIQYKIAVGNTVIPFEHIHDSKFIYELIRTKPAFFKSAFDFCANFWPCALYAARHFNGIGRKLNKSNWW